jgi:hypothetical protein
MPFRDGNARRITRKEILMDEDAFFVPPDLYYNISDK